MQQLFRNDQEMFCPLLNSKICYHEGIINLSLSFIVSCLLTTYGDIFY